MESNSGSLLTVQQVAELLGVPPSWIYQRMGGEPDDHPPGYKIGKYWRFRKEEVLAWVETKRI